MAENGRRIVKKQIAILALITCSTIAEAAKDADVSERTLYRWLDDPGFRQELSIIQKRELELVEQRLCGLLNEAVSTYASVIRDPTCSAGSRVKAAQAIFDQFIQIKNYREIEPRISAIETVLRNIFDE